MPGSARHVEVEGRPRPVASLLGRGAALAVDLCFAVCGAALALDLVSFVVPLDTDRAVAPIFTVVGALAAYILWLRDRGVPPPGGGPRWGLSLGRRLLGLALVPVAGPRRLARPVTVSVVEAAKTGDDTARVLRAVLLGVGASLVAVLLLGHAVSRTTVFLAVQSHTHHARPFAAERGGAPRLAAIPSSLLVGRRRAYVRVDAKWGGGGAGDPLEFFLERTGDGGERRRRGGGDGGADDQAWRVVATRIGEPAFLRRYALAAPDADVPSPTAE